MSIIEDTATYLQHISEFLDRGTVAFWKVTEPHGFLSQWYSCRFEENSIEFNSAEQYMMWRKAKLFGDIGVANKILDTANQATIKRLGRQVKNFDENLWCQHRVEIVIDGNMLKFQADKSLRERLLTTGDTILVETSPYDKIWGVGSTSKANIKYWKGSNLLGQILMYVRKELQQS